jgi:type IV pilus assembly protein PilW
VGRVRRKNRRQHGHGRSPISLGVFGQQRGDHALSGRIDGVLRGNQSAGEPALYRARGAGDNTFATGEELVEGIESLQFLYGLDTETAISSTAPPTGVIVDQKTASGVSTGTDAAAAGAVAARWHGAVGLLVRSPARRGRAGQTAVAQLGVLGVGFNPPTTYDDRYRSSYEVSVALRNRLFGN